MHNRQAVLDYWNDPNVESMYDKYLIDAEINLIRRRLLPDSKILDAGCGEGEGSVVYAGIKGASIVAADFSDTRLAKAKERLAGLNNVSFQKVDFLDPWNLGGGFDAVVSQRFLINLMEWPLQQKVLAGLIQALSPSGRLILLEGHQKGVDELNAYRQASELEPIPVKWHNLFLDEDKLLPFMRELGCDQVDEDGLGAYFLLTRGVRPQLATELNWDCDFNRRAASPEVSDVLQLKAKFSRLKLWVFQKARAPSK